MDSFERPLLQIRLENFLSFGPDTPPLDLQNLNVLIGPNGSGKSNLIEALAVMRSTPIPPAVSNYDLRGVLRRGGGAQAWIWKGSEIATLETVVSDLKSEVSLRHELRFSADKQGVHLDEESIQSKAVGTVGADVLLGRIPPSGDARSSVLSQWRDRERYPGIARLTEVYENIRIYREWAFGRNTAFREPQRADERNDRLEEDFSNLGLFLSRLRKQPAVKAAILDGLKDLYEGFTDFEVFVEGGTVQLFFTEGDYTIPATRLSDGTLRYLCLLAILCDPSPPPLICIEEPELGLHPDILPKLADLLVAASERTQIIATTHSDVLVDALTERPEVVVVCEKRDGKTEMRRLRKEDLADWLEKYRLGQLWIRGEIGGTRW